MPTSSPPQLRAVVAVAEAVVAAVVAAEVEEEEQEELRAPQALEGYPSI